MILHTLLITFILTLSLLDVWRINFEGV